MDTATRKAVQRRLYTLLSSRYWLTLLVVGAVVVLFSILSFGEVRVRAAARSLGPSATAS